MTDWLIGQAGLTALRTLNPPLAAKFFNRSRSYVIGFPPADWDTRPVVVYNSYAAFTVARVSAHRWVLYTPEYWNADYTKTPLVEQQHPVAYLQAFATLAHARSQYLIASPARDLMAQETADYSTKTNNEPVDTAFIKAGLPAACAGADVFNLQNQANQDDLPAFTSLLNAAANQVPVNQRMWCGLTTLRGDTAAQMTAAYEVAKVRCSGIWLNTNAATIGVAEAFLKSL